MKINDNCLPCLVSQVVKVANITHATHTEKLYKTVFQYLSTMDFSRTNPEVIGKTFQILKNHIGNNDPYKDIRNDYNQLMLKEIDQFEQKIQQAEDSFNEMIKYAIMGNIIDFNPIHHINMNDIMKEFEAIDQMKLVIDDSLALKEDIMHARKILYLGDNCGEICIDKIFLKMIKKMNPQVQIYFATRGAAVVNDSIEEDAYQVGIDEYATIISNGDYSLGTILSRTSDQFNEIYRNADVIISKGSANYESLSEEKENIYFLLMVKCEVIAQYIGAPIQSLICMKN